MPMNNFYCITYDSTGETVNKYFQQHHTWNVKYYSNLKKLCIAHNLEYNNLYWHINRKKKGEWSNDFIIVTKHEML